MCYLLDLQPGLPRRGVEHLKVECRGRKLADGGHVPEGDARTLSPLPLPKGNAVAKYREADTSLFPALFILLTL